MNFTWLHTEPCPNWDMEPASPGRKNIGYSWITMVECHQVIPLHELHINFSPCMHGSSCLEIHPWPADTWYSRSTNTLFQRIYPTNGYFKILIQRQFPVNQPIVLLLLQIFQFQKIISSFKPKRRFFCFQKKWKVV